MPPSVKRPTLAQVMILRFVNYSPASGFVLMAQSLEPALDSVSPSLPAPPPLVLCLSVSLSQKQINVNTITNGNEDERTPKQQGPEVNPQKPGGCRYHRSGAGAPQRAVNRTQRTYLGEKLLPRP